MVHHESIPTWPASDWSRGSTQTHGAKHQEGESNSLKRLNGALTDLTDLRDLRDLTNEIWAYTDGPCLRRFFVESRDVGARKAPVAGTDRRRGERIYP